MIFNFKYKKKSYSLDVKECNTFFSQLRGLMFKKNSKPLLFNFKTSRRIRIHSFFCVPFYVIWFNGDNVVEAKIVNSWRPWIIPKEKFDKLLEIPSNSLEFMKFADDGRYI